MAISKIDSDGITAGGITADSLNIGQIGGRRNIAYNGAMTVWQRGTSADTATTADYMADRWSTTFSGLDGNVDWDQETSSTPDGFGYALKISTDASETSLGASDFLRFRQKFEGQDLQQIQKGTSGAKSLTLSFWVKSSVASTYTVELFDADNTRNISKSYVIDTADTWEFKTLTFEGDTTGALTNDNGESLRVEFWIDAGSDFTSGTFSTAWQANDNTERVYDTTGWLESTTPTFFITGVQLEVGDTATPFEHRSYQDELLACCRYYFKKDIESAGRYFGLGNIDGSTGTQIKIDFPVPMRTAPTSVETTGTGSDYRIRVNSNQDCDAVPLFIETCRWNSSLNFRKSTGHGGTNGQAAFGVAATDGSYLAWSAEL